MNPAETFLLVYAPITILVVAALAFLAMKIAARRFAVREQFLLDRIEEERAALNREPPPNRTRKRNRPSGTSSDEETGPDQPKAPTYGGSREQRGVGGVRRVHK